MSFIFSVIAVTVTAPILDSRRQGQTAGGKWGEAHSEYDARWKAKVTNEAGTSFRINRMRREDASIPDLLGFRDGDSGAGSARDGSGNEAVMSLRMSEIDFTVPSLFPI